MGKGGRGALGATYTGRRARSASAPAAVKPHSVSAPVPRISAGWRAARRAPLVPPSAAGSTTRGRRDVAPEQVPHGVLVGLRVPVVERHRQVGGAARRAVGEAGGAREQDRAVLGRQRFAGPLDQGSHSLVASTWVSVAAQRHVSAGLPAGEHRERGVAGRRVGEPAHGVARAGGRVQAEEARGVRRLGAYASAMAAAPSRRAGQ
ncbi:hypothetical protein GCM10023082_31320 [Streptomyces tremellae]|uniref:Uncharacterized protein n=1 Tax=Streptomyces tremellae TaxID=1124239 RepID=A0ABP7F7Q6_9ACTN